MHEDVNQNKNGKADKLMHVQTSLFTTNGSNFKKTSKQKNVKCDNVHCAIQKNPTLTERTELKLKFLDTPGP